MSDLLEHAKGRAGALAAIGAAAFCTIVLLAFLVSGVFSFAEGDTDTELHQMAIFRAEAQARPVVEARLRQTLQQASTAPGLIQAASAALAEASLQSDIKAVARENGAEVRSAELLPAENVSDFEVDAIQFDLTVPMSRLRDLTYAIESRTPNLFIDHVTISGGQGFEPQNNQPHDPSLDVRWTVRGYRWAGKR